MLRNRFVFNIFGDKANVDKASIDIKNIIHELTKEPVDIIMEGSSTILRKVNTNNMTYFNINKCYDDRYDCHKITELSRHIRSLSHDTIHPWNLHVDAVDTLYVSNFMKSCSQINCVYPLNASYSDKKKAIEVFLD
jgi:hypothetical protein